MSLRKGSFFDAIKFADANHGIALSDPVDGRFFLVTTSDGGGFREITYPGGALLSALPMESVSDNGLGDALLAQIFSAPFGPDDVTSWRPTPTPSDPPEVWPGIGMGVAAVGGAMLVVALATQGEASTLYNTGLDAPNDEATGLIGGDELDAPASWRFSIEVAQAWEQALADADTPATRKVAMRSAMVMSPDRGGIFDTLLGLTRRGLGGTSGDGSQYVSWLHQEDFMRAVTWLIEHDDVAGPVNLAAPNPLPNAEFMRALRQAWGTRVGLPAAHWMLEAGAVLMRTETELVLKSRRVVPGRLLDAGFEFRHPTWPEAARDLCEQRRR